MADAWALGSCGASSGLYTSPARRDLPGSSWSNTTCPDGTNSDANGNTCVGHF